MMLPISQGKSCENDGELNSILEDILDHQDDILQSTAGIIIHQQKIQ